MVMPRVVVPANYVIPAIHMGTFSLGCQDDALACFSHLPPALLHLRHPPLRVLGPPRASPTRGTHTAAFESGVRCAVAASHHM